MFCNSLLPFWRTFSQSLPSRKNPSPVAELRSAPPSPTRGEGRKIDTYPAMTAARIHRLTLTHFRNYRAASLQTRGDVVVLVGPNGAGKTNCIEAISFLSPGRGLRRATLDDVADIQGDGSWAVSAEVEGALGLATLGTGLDAPGVGAAAFVRPAGAGERLGAFQPRLRVGPLVTFAQPHAGGAQLRRPLV